MFDKRRREFITLLGGAAVWPLHAHAQQKRSIGWLVTGSPASYRHSLAAFQDGLRKLRHVEGENVQINYKWAQGDVSRLPELAQQLVREGAHVILAGGSVGAEAAKRVTSVIPIVAAGVGDLVELGLVASLARPAGNLTGFIAAAPETAGKRLQMITEIRANAKRVAALWNPTSSNAQLELKNVKAVAPSGLDVTLHDARDASELKRALENIRHSAPDVLIVLNDPFMFSLRKTVTESVRDLRVPAVYGYREYAEDGGLISYGANISDTYRRAADYVDKILKGAQPGDLPVQLPTMFELVINMRTARALGIDVPPQLLARADEVIE